VTIGDYGQLETRLAASGPLTDTFAIGGAVFGAMRDGYVENPVTGEDYNDRNAWGGRFQAAWEPTSNLSFDFAVDYSEEDNALTMGQPTTTLVNFGGITYFNIPGSSFPTAAEPEEFDFTAQATPGLPNSSVMDHGGVSLRASWEVNENWTINSITAARELNYTDYIDIDATPVEFGDVLVDVAQDQFSQELQAIYESDRFTLVSGLFYLRENVGSHQEAYADDLVTGFFGLGPGFLRTIDDDLETTSTAIYANLSYAVTDRLNLGLGLRYSEEEKTYDRTTSTFYATNPFFNGTFAFLRNETWDNTTPMVSLDYEFADNIMLYARYAEGFKSGGFNGRANGDGEDAPYEPETVSSFEVGARTDWMDGRLLLNATAFYNDYTDFQARISGTVIDPDTLLPSPELTVINAGQLEISGAELEARFRATDNFTLDAQIGYLDASYGEFDDARFPGGSRTFQTPAFSPEWTARFGGFYTLDLGDMGDLDLAASARFRSRMALAIDNTFVVGGLVGTTTEVPGLWQDDYWLYDASATWRATDVLSIALVGRNLSDEVYKTDAQEFSSIGEIRTAYYGAPRTVSVVFTARY